MKTPSVIFLTEQGKRTGAKTVKNLWLYEFYPGVIVEYVNPAQIRVDGNAADFFSTKDLVIIDTEDFETEFDLSGVVYANGVTTLSTGGAWPTTCVGGVVGKRSIADAEVIKYGTVRNQVDASKLTEHVAGDMEVVLENSTGKYYDLENESGIFYRRVYQGVTTSVSSGAPTSIITIPAGGFGVNDLRGEYFRFLNGPYQGRRYSIISNTANTVTIYASIPDAVHGAGEGYNYIIDIAHKVYVKFFAGYKDITDFTADRMLYHGGMVYQDSIRHDRYTRQLTFRVMGFLKELDYYQASGITEANGYLPRIGGLKIDGYQESNMTITGRKALKYSFNSESGISGVDVIEIHASHGGMESNWPGPGLYVLRFVPPNDFNWDNYFSGVEGTYYTTIAGAGQTRLDGLHCDITIETRPDRYPLDVTMLLVHVDEEFRPSTYGRITLEYDEGVPLDIVPFFHRIIANLPGDGAYREEGRLSSSDKSSSSLLNNNNNEYYFGSAQPFAGIAFWLYNEFAGVINYTVQYSLGDGIWSADIFGSCVDETGGFKESGRLRWGTIEDWTSTNLTVGNVAYGNLYWIKLQRTSGAGNVSLIRAHRLPYIIGADEDTISFEIELRYLPKESKEDSVVIRENADGSYSACAWRQNLMLETVVQELLELRGYLPARRTLGDFMISSDAKFIGYLGRCPRFSYPYKVRSIFWDEVTEYLFVGVGPELWKVSRDTDFEFVGNVLDLAPVGGVTYGSNLWDLRLFEIKRLARFTDAFEDDGIVGIAWEPNTPNNWGHWTPPTFYKPKVTPFITFWSDGNTIDARNDALWWEIDFNFWNGEVHFRRGEFRLGGTDYLDFGQLTAGSGYGENLTCPTPTLVMCLNQDNQVDPIDIHTCEGLIGNPVSLILSIKDQSYGFGREKHRVYNAGPGHYKINDTGGTVYDILKELNIRWTMGQKGCVEFDNVQGNLQAMRGFFYASLVNPTVTTPGGSALIYTDHTTHTITSDAMFYSTNDQVTSWFTKLEGALWNSIIYMAHVHWWDDGVNEISYSYLSRKASGDGFFYSWTTAFGWDQTTMSFTPDQAALLYAGVAAIPLNENGDAIYLGHTRKSFAFWYTITGWLWNMNFDVTYWNGAAWVQFPWWAMWPGWPNAVNHYELPRDWVPNNVNGVTLYWIKIEVSGYVSGTATMTTCGIAHEVLWDSQDMGGYLWDDTAQQWNWKAAGYFKYYHFLEIIWKPDEERIYGAAFNRNDGNEIADTEPFQYFIFILDLSDLPNTTIFFTNAGTNFSYNKTHQTKAFMHNTVDDYIYACVCDLRRREKTPILTKMNWAGAPNPLNWQRLASVERGFDIPHALVHGTSDGEIYGITDDGEDQYLFLWWNEYHPRVDIVDFEDLTIREALNLCAEYMMDYCLDVNPRNQALMVPRSRTAPSMNLFAQHVMEITGRRPWKHWYQGVMINWEDPVKETSGTEKIGIFHEQTKPLTISNQLIQNRHIAGVLGLTAYAYFIVKRDEIEAKLEHLVQLELLDEIIFYVASRFTDISEESAWIINEIDFDPAGDNIKLLGVENV
jgi:hypothetical protein